MAAKYRKVDPRIWNDEKFRKLDGDEQRIALYCLTSDQTNRIGLFVFSPAKASEDLNMDFETFAKRFGNVSHTFNWGWDKGSRTLYFPTWWKYNAPDNPNHMKGNLEDCHDLPASPFWVKFCSNTPAPQRKRIANVYPYVRQTFR